MLIYYHYLCFGLQLQIMHNYAHLRAPLFGGFSLFFAGIRIQLLILVGNRIKFMSMIGIPFQITNNKNFDKVIWSIR